MILPQAVTPAAAASERAIYLYYTHTQETARIVFKRNGQYVQSGLNELNVFLRDWRRNEPAKMDPRLFDLVWEVYQEVGATQPINVVSAYRSPQTNAMLAKTSSGVADNSQHMRGTAMDFFIPGIPLAKLRATAMRKQVGGVGFYPTSGSPFVHLDVGSVRAWPRMTRAQLQEVFPDGKTMHLPTDGKPLSQEGYQVAMAGWKQCHRYPCSGTDSGTQTASNGGSGKTLMDMFFGGNGEQQQAAAPAARASAPAPAPVQVASVAPQSATTDVAPVPAARPAAFGGVMAPVETASAAIPFSTTGSAPLDPSELASAEVAPLPLMKSEAIRVATAAALPSGDAVTALAALTAPMPQPRLIMSEREQPEAMTAYIAQDGNAQRALEMIIDNNTTAAVPPAPATRQPILPLTVETGLRTASLGGTPATSGAFGNLFDSTFGSAQQNETTAAALAEHIAKRPVPGAMRNPQMIAPDLEHADMLTAPEAVTSERFAIIWDHDQADFDPTAEMGKYVTVMSAGDAPVGLSHTSFVTAKPAAAAFN
ncbi:MAG: DUF882 domain-containing protein [Candidatus Devosia phytovorans]|uniref:Murein endopeptidase K n=1 Tax=Candidatus Devosia phytovorans TaxID=3121372 RepID=A0AAJ6B118_9HYPH|nr:DUF882 domain-containing protein [Devosia sp.]WEK04839.1 MAG: DUF882 domain-containing protein [Devosia sp.]